jgi:hypothetical protein
MEISTIKAKLEATQAALRVLAAAAREDRLKLREREYLVESLGAVHRLPNPCVGIGGDTAREVQPLMVP